MPNSTQPIIVSKGSFDGNQWFFLAKVSPPGGDIVSTDFLQVGQRKIPGNPTKKSLCTAVATTVTSGFGGASGPCCGEGPGPFDLSEFGGGQLSMILGVTALPVSSIQITFSAAAAPVNPVTVIAIPGIHFFAEPIPNLGTNLLKAIGYNNRVLAQAEWPIPPAPTSVVSIPG